MIKCNHCGFQATTQQEESSIQYHHKIPKYMGGTDKDGRIALCKKCHDMSHSIIMKLVYGCVENKEVCKNEILKFTEIYKKY